MMNRLNVLHLIETSEPGGAETVLAYIASNLDTDRYRSIVCVLEDGWLTDHLSSLGIPHVMIENRWSYDPVFLFKLLRLIRREKIDLIHSHEFMMTVYGSLSARLARIPHVGTIHGKVYYPDRQRRVRMLRMAAGLCSRLIAVSDDLNRFLTTLLSVRSGKIETLYNGIDLEKYRSVGLLEESRERLGLRDMSIVLGTVGSLFEVKGLPYLLEAIARLRNKYPRLSLLIAGEGNREDSLKTIANQLELGNTVRFLGFRDDIPDILQAVDIYVCSSVSEGLSLSILEAMAMSKPVVATDVGGNPELIADGANGFLVPAKDPVRLADAIAELINSPERRLEFGTKSREVVENRFSLERMVRDYEKLYEQVISK
jgi:glycosyltransferase involved in cell wall biosynthesis